MTANLALVFLFYCCSSFQLPEKPISVIDFVKIKDNHRPEAVYFYTNNWMVYREIALKKDQILSYQILQTIPDSILNVDLILTTVYKDSTQYYASETNFAAIIKAERPNGPRLLNSLKPADFRQLIATKVAERLFSNPGAKATSF